jgi:hypothetical protein
MTKAAAKLMEHVVLPTPPLPLVYADDLSLFLTDVIDTCCWSIVEGGRLSHLAEPRHAKALSLANCAIFCVAL